MLQSNLKVAKYVSVLCNSRKGQYVHVFEQYNGKKCGQLSATMMFCYCEANLNVRLADIRSLSQFFSHSVRATP